VVKEGKSTCVSSRKFERLEELRVVQKPPNWSSDLLVNHEPSDVIFSPVELRHFSSIHFFL